MKIIAKIINEYECKFGIPRQSGLINGVESLIVFEKEFKDENFIRGIEEFSHLWLIWQFSKNADKNASPTVRPPKLGGNERVGVFATRSPFRPNPIGLSSVKLERVEKTLKFGTCLVVSGADLLNGTPIYDIKPYLSYTDCHLDAQGGFTQRANTNPLKVEFKTKVNEVLKTKLAEILSLDPRPSYQTDSERIYSFEFSGHNIKFKVINDTAVVTEIRKHE